MSVEVKTPSPAHFEHKEYPFGTSHLVGGKTSSDLSTITNSSNQHGKRNPEVGTSKDDSYIQPNRNSKKRRFSEAHKFNPLPLKRRFSKGNKGKIVLPTKFLLGGNINDPLNLNSLNDEKVNAALNAETPKSSPLPIPSHRSQVRVLIPPNINDPLNLNSGEDLETCLLSPKMSNKKRKKHKKRKSTGDASAIVQTDGNDKNEEESKMGQLKLIIPDETDANKNLNSKMQGLIDKIVSPVIPQTSPKWKRKRTISENKESTLESTQASSTVTSSTSAKIDIEPKPSPIKPKVKKQHSSGQAANLGPKFRKKDQKFIHGNYDRYYGKRNQDDEDDCRLKCFHKDWFDGKDVLDVGCNIGHVTLTLARDLSPRKIVGMDIDSKLVSIARKNIRHYMSEELKKGKKYPVSLQMTYGPLAAPPLPGEQAGFPNNVSFLQGNYVLATDELVELQREEYDCILALSVSKWIHLNNGDAGMKRFFRRVHKHLRPGGKFVLEPQSWVSYKKKKKLTPKILENYNSIRFRPEHFTAYLLSTEVGFITCDLIDRPYNKNRGFQRPIQVFTKPDTSYTTPREVTESRGVTPLMEINCTPHFEMPSYTPTDLFAAQGIYPGYTPDRATPSYAMWSSNATPRIDPDSSSNTPGFIGGSYSRGTTPGQSGGTPRTTPGNGSGVDATALETAMHKYTSFVSGDPRGSYGAGMSTGAGGSAAGESGSGAGGSASRSGTPVKMMLTEQRKEGVRAGSASRSGTPVMVAEHTDDRSMDTGEDSRDAAKKQETCDTPTRQKEEEQSQRNENETTDSAENNDTKIAAKQQSNNKEVETGQSSKDDDAVQSSKQLEEHVVAGDLTSNQIKGETSSKGETSTEGETSTKVDTSTEGGDGVDSQGQSSQEIVNIVGTSTEVESSAKIEDVNCAKVKDCTDLTHTNVENSAVTESTEATIETETNIKDIVENSRKETAEETSKETSGSKEETNKETGDEKETVAKESNIDS